MLATLSAVMIALAAWADSSAAPFSAGSEEHSREIGQQADWYYPSEEPAERASLKYPRLLDISEAAIRLAASDQGQATRVPLGGEFAGWQVVETLDKPEPLVVLERDFSGWGLFVFLGREGVVATVRKAVGRLEAMREPRADFAKDYFAGLLAAKDDVLGDKVLAFKFKRDPCYASVAGLLAPLASYTFLGSPESAAKYIVQPDGAIGLLPNRWGSNKPLEKVLFDPKAAVGLDDAKSGPGIVKRGLLGGYLPAVDYGFLAPDGRTGWELSALMERGGSSSVFVRVRRTGGQTAFYRLPPVEKLADGKAFFMALLELQRSWQQFLAGGMQFDVADRRVADAARGALARALSGCAGLHPKYGMGAYWGANDLHDGFPPTTLSLSTCLLDWGLDQAARERLGYYLDRFVKADGTLNYYGPAVAEYGELVDLAAAMVRRTGDRKWFDRHRGAIDRLVDYLLRLRARSLQTQPRDAPSYGLLFGGAEADTHKETNYYFSGSAWCWRGLLEIGRLFVEIGGQRRDAALEARGRQLLAECDALKTDILRAADRAVARSPSGPFLPPIAGPCKPFATMTQDQLASYTNYRYWLETLSARCLPPDKERMMIDYRVSRGGELLGMTRFEDRLDDWPYYHYAWSILGHDRVERYLLGYYAHLAHHQMPGTFTAYEQVPIRGQGFRREDADYCVPSQLTVPLLTRWMLVFEERDADVLWLCRAVPREWLAQRLAFRKVLTRWGLVSAELQPAADLRTIRARIELPGERKPSVVLRVRHPQQMRLVDCRVEGGRCDQLDAGGELVRLKPERGKMILTLTFRP